LLLHAVRLPHVFPPPRRNQGWYSGLCWPENGTTTLIVEGELVNHPTCCLNRCTGVVHAGNRRAIPERARAHRATLPGLTCPVSPEVCIQSKRICIKINSPHRPAWQAGWPDKDPKNAGSPVGNHLITLLCWKHPAPSINTCLPRVVGTACGHSDLYHKGRRNRYLAPG
jgi:hypothetical protein